MIYKPNFSNAMVKANEILVSSNTITDFPFSPIRTSTHSMSVEEREKYGSYEIEANYFVAQLVMPLQLLIALEKKGYDINPNFLQKNFGVSNEAATKRVRCFNKNKHIKFSLAERKYDIAILKKYKHFLGSSEQQVSYTNLFSAIAI